MSSLLSVDEADSSAAAAVAGLHHVSDVSPGIRRIRCGSGFRYLGPGNRPVTGAARDRIRALAVPPAWTDVWICTRPDGHLQATGRDAKGRKQYRYHDRWRTVRDADKFEHLSAFGAALGPLRSGIDTELARSGPLDRDQVLALVVHLLDDTLIRVGNAEYAATNNSYGLTTFGPEHVAVAGAEVRFHFVGKSGVEHEVTRQDGRLARLVKRCHELGGQELFAWRDERGGVVDVGSTDVNDWLRERTGQPISAKDFRTWGATAIVTETLAAEDAPAPDGAGVEAAILRAIDAAADQLGNTRAVCRSSYVHPVVPDAFRAGTLHEHWLCSRTTVTLRRAERTLLALLAEQLS